MSEEEKATIHAPQSNEDTELIHPLTGEEPSSVDVESSLQQDFVTAPLELPADSTNSADFSSPQSLDEERMLTIRHLDSAIQKALSHVSPSSNTVLSVPVRLGQEDIHMANIETENSFEGAVETSFTSDVVPQSSSTTRSQQIIPQNLGVDIETTVVSEEPTLSVLHRSPKRNISMIKDDIEEIKNLVSDLVMPTSPSQRKASRLSLAASEPQGDSNIQDMENLARAIEIPTSRVQEPSTPRVILNVPKYDISQGHSVSPPKTVPKRSTLDHSYSALGAEALPLTSKGNSPSSPERMPMPSNYIGYSASLLEPISLQSERHSSSSHEPIAGPSTSKDNKTSNLEKIGSPVSYKDSSKCKNKSGIPLNLTIFERFINFIKNQDDVYIFMGHFSSKVSLTDMLSYLWSNKAFHYYSGEPKFVYKKDEAKAESWGSLANELHDKRSMDKALFYYNNCIVCAPDSTESHVDRCLANAYINRSALLFELGQYKKCLDDIFRAYREGFPRDNKQIWDRKNKAMSLLRTMEIQQKKETNIPKLPYLPEYQPLPDCCRIKEIGESKSTRESYQYLFTGGGQKIPSLGEHFNSKVPGLTLSANIKYSDEKGRYLCATSDIYPGELIISEKPFSFALLKDFEDFYCTNCFIKTVTPVPCPTCTRAVFCSNNCLTEALNSYHSFECRIMGSISDLESEDFLSYAMLLIRILSKMPYKTLRKRFRELQEEDENKPLRLKGYDKNGVYDSSDYRTIFFLQCHKDKYSSDKFLRATFEALIVLKAVAVERNYVGADIQLHEELPLPVEYLKLGEILLYHNLALLSNTYYAEQTAIYENDEGEGIVSGLYVSGLTGLINNCCLPNAMKCYYGSNNVLKALDFIPRGSEITIAYAGAFDRTDRELRMKLFRDEYYFTCDCIPCVYNWPTRVRFQLNTAPYVFCAQKDKNCQGRFTEEGCNICKAQSVYFMRHLTPRKKGNGWYKGKAAFEVVIRPVLINYLKDLAIDKRITNYNCYYNCLTAIAFTANYVQRPHTEIALFSYVVDYEMRCGFHHHAFLSDRRLE